MLENDKGLLDETIKGNEIPEVFLTFDEIEKVLESEIGNQITELKVLKENKNKISNPDSLGQVVANVVWEQFINQIGEVAGKDFIRENRGLKLDLRNSAHIQTTENFAKGSIATHNTKIDYQKRYDDWQSNFVKDETGKIVTKFDRIDNEEKAVLVKGARASFDKDRPKGSKVEHMDHTVSAGEEIKDPRANAHLSKEEQIAFLNSEKNLKPLDSAANESKGDHKMENWLNSERDGKKPAERFNIDEQQKREDDKIAREEKEKVEAEGERRSIQTGKQSQKEEAFRIGGKALRAVLMGLLAELAKDIIRKLVAWFKTANRSLKTFLNSIKESVIEFVQNFKQHLVTATDTLLTTIATAIWGPIISTLKKVWIFLKQGYHSLKEAIDYIKAPENANKAFEILMFEVGKIVVAGLTAGGAIILSEVISKGLMTVPIFAVEIPLLGSLASLMGMFLGAVISGIIGAMVLNLIDRSTAKIQLATIRQQEDRLSTKIIAESAVLAHAKAVKTGVNVVKTMEFSGQSILEMGGKSRQTKNNQAETSKVLDDANKTTNRTTDIIGSLLSDDEQDFEL